MSRLSKDQDTLDTEISMTAFQVWSLVSRFLFILRVTLLPLPSFYLTSGSALLLSHCDCHSSQPRSSVIGTVVLVFYTFPYLGIIFVPLGVFYWLAAMYYRRTSVETKRLDSLMRSALYASYSGKFLLRRKIQSTVINQSLFRGTHWS